MRFLPRLFALAATLPTVVQAANSSEFFYGQSYANLSLALTTVADTGDIYFRWSAPSEYDWVAFGIGAQMKNALMIVMYTSKNGSAVTVSPRLASGHAEPAWAPSIMVERINVANDPSANTIDTSNGGYMQVSAVCRKCASLANPPLELSSTTAPFMFAIGPVNDGTSTRQFDELDAPLRPHTIHGQFTMDVRQATVQSGGNVTVPTLKHATDGASGIENLTNSPHDYSSAAHAVVLCLAFGFLLPMDAILFRLFRKSRVHHVLQGVFGVLFVTGLAIGFYVSTIFVRSKTVSSPHQVLGIVPLLIWLAQAGLGFMYHRKKNQNSLSNHPSTAPKWLSTSHLALTALMFLLGIIDAAIGFNFSLSPGYNKAWIPLVIGVTIVFLVATGTRYCIDTRRGDGVDEKRLERATADAWAQYHEEQRMQRGEFESYAAQQGQGKGAGVVVQSYELQDRNGGHGGGEVQYESVGFPKAR